MQSMTTSSQRLLRTEIARVTVSGLSASYVSTATVLPEGFTAFSAAKSATGTFSMKLLNPFQRVPVVTITPLSAASLNVTLTAVTASQIDFKIYTSSTAAATDPTSIIVVVQGSDSADGVI